MPIKQKKCRSCDCKCSTSTERPCEICVSCGELRDEVQCPKCDNGYMSGVVECGKCDRVFADIGCADCGYFPLGEKIRKPIYDVL